MEKEQSHPRKGLCCRLNSIPGGLRMAIGVMMIAIGLPLFILPIPLGLFTILTGLALLPIHCTCYVGKTRWIYFLDFDLATIFTLRILWTILPNVLE